MKSSYSDAILILQPKALFHTRGDKITFWEDETITQPTHDEIIAKLAELELGDPMRILKEQRTQRLLQTDWQASSDLTMTADQKAYRQALRDLPTTATPALDENGELTGVVWPTEPA